MYTFSAHACRENTTFRTLKHCRILVDENACCCWFETSYRASNASTSKDVKKKEEIFHVPGNTFHREIDAGHDARKKETESASSSSSSWCCRPRRRGILLLFFVLLFSREWAKRRKRAYEDFSLISASSRRALWIPRGTTRGGLRCVMMYALLMFYYYVKKSFFLFRSLSLLSVSPFSLKWCVFCIAAVIIAPFFSSLSPSSLSFFNSFSRRAICDAYYYLLLDLTLVRVFLLNLWR